MGNKKRPFFRIVATNTASRRDGRLLEFLATTTRSSQPR